MKTNEKGFGIIEITLLIVMVAVIGVTGFYYFDASRPSDKPYAVTSTPKGLYTNNTKLYTATLPKGWTASEATADNSAWYLSDYDLADTKYASFTPPNAPLSGAVVNLSKNLDNTANSVSIFAFKTNDTHGVLKKWNDPKDELVTSKDLKINNYHAAYSQASVSSSGSSIDINGYVSTIDSYAITNNGITLLIAFMEKQSSDEPSEAKTFNATADVPQFDGIVQSVRFLN